MILKYTTHSPEETEQLGASLAKTLRPGAVIAFSGEPGAGKTVFTRGILHGLGYKGRVTSPTFTIANEYNTPAGPVVHLDLYRLTNQDALFETGFEEYLNGDRIVLMEWSENADGLLPEHSKSVRLLYGNGEKDRLIIIEEKEGDTN